MMACVYPAVVAVTAMGRRLQNRKSAARVIGTATVGSIVFFLIPNLGSWFAMTEDYPRTLAGLVDCYIAGLPFFRNTLIGDLAYTSLLFGGFGLLERVVPQVRVAREAT